MMPSAAKWRNTKAGAITWDRDDRQSTIDRDVYRPRSMVWVPKIPML